MDDWEAKRSLFPIPAHSEGNPAWAAYVNACSDYLKRQLIVYQNWPQRKFTTIGYAEEKVFTDMNA